MLNNLLKVSEELALKGYPKDDVPIGEVALYALLGLIVVFIGIAFLIFVVWAVGKLMTKFTSGPVKTEKAEKIEETVAQQVQAVSEEDLAEETVAVITAAIMAYYTKENRKCEFTVKRIKRL
ncbi:MAG: OadG family protein [Clostridia bacterium]|nr:OadG family protein [Clostridia bacterium]